MTRKKAVKKKLEIVFDAQKRKEFLTGFRKRKNERRSRAKADLERNLKEEHKRIRLELKEGFKNLKRSFEPLRELTEEDKQDATNADNNEGEVYEDDEVQVKITELTTNDLAAQRNMLGDNCGEESDVAENEPSESEDETLEVNRIPGMDFDIAKKRKKRTVAAQHVAAEEVKESENQAPQQSGSSRKNHLGIDASQVKSKKDINRLMKTKTMNKLKNSKLFKMKERFDKQANQKKAKRDRNNTIKSVPKHQRKKLKFEQKSRYRKGRLMNRKEIRKRRSGGE